MYRIFTFSLISFAFVVSLLTVDRAEAIPAFARKYKISCSTCHVAIPKLKAMEMTSRGTDFYFLMVKNPNVLMSIPAMNPYRL